MKIAIAGYGIEGEENYAYWSADPSNELTIIDESERPARPIPTGAKTILGPGVFDQLEGYDLVIRTASLSPHRIETDGKIWSATNEFFASCPAPIIGVTGSKGKGTTASFIVSILEAAGKKVWFVGNVGTPALRVLSQVSADDIVVYELSSFQLWDLERSPHVAVALFIEPEHLNVHASMDDYVSAKTRITKFQTPQDTFIFSASNQYTLAMADKTQAQKRPFPSADGARTDGEYFYYGETQLCPTGAVQLKGMHNVQNAVAAIEAAWLYTQDKTVIETGLRAFTGLPHRLHYVATVDGVEYYDDSIATTPTSAIAALRAFPDSKKVIILGGSSKGSDYSELAEELTRHDVHAILIGEEAATIATACQDYGFEAYEIIDNATAEAFTQRAAELASPGSVVLLSPASASFGLFKDYADRGDQYVAAVHRLGKSE